MTYSGREPGTKDITTKGGYSDHVIVNKECVRIPRGNVVLQHSLRIPSRCTMQQRAS